MRPSAEFAQHPDHMRESVQSKSKGPARAPRVEFGAKHLGTVGWCDRGLRDSDADGDNVEAALIQVQVKRGHDRG